MHGMNTVSGKYSSERGSGAILRICMSFEFCSVL